MELGNGAPVAKSRRAAFEAERDRLAALLYGGAVTPPAQLVATAN